MKHVALTAAAAVAIVAPLGASLSAQEEIKAAPSPNEIVNAAPAEKWLPIAADDLLVMTLAPGRDGMERKVVIQLMPAPFSQGWVENIRTLARAKWYDGISVNRVQDNYVVQWGDPGHDNPEGQGIETKPLPEGLRVMGEEEYLTAGLEERFDYVKPLVFGMRSAAILGGLSTKDLPLIDQEAEDELFRAYVKDRYAPYNSFLKGWPIASGKLDAGPFKSSYWPVHCYGMVGVGRNFSPDTGSGAELYTVIGHAPRHLDRNIALAGRIIHGMGHLSSLPRGSGVLGFYTDEEADLRTPILSIRVASDLPETEQPQFEYLSTESETFAKYADARANRRDPFFIVPAGGADICNIPVPIREVDAEDHE
ncbi:MAG: peptidylprolyl isomerase [Pseudomonadota bacterium]